MGVILYRIILHMIYRKRIMTDLIPPSEDVASLWEKVFIEAIPERKGALRKRKITELWISPEVKTPLTVGIIKLVVLLPAHDYSKKELSIIFRHELVHIRRSDTGTRFYMAFCNAVFWFFPPIWKRISHMAEDIELSCDETVLEEADNDARKEYAELILKTAGDNHGFTTALSTTAASLKYRMEQILRPVKRGNGAVLTGMLLFPLMVVNSSTAYTYHPQTVNDLLFHEHAVSLSSVYRYGVGTNIAFNCTDEERLLKCLGEFEISSLSCPSAIPTDLTADRLNIVLDSDDEQYTIAFQEGFLMLYRKQNLTSREVYVLEKGSMDDLMVFLESDASRDYRQLLPVLTLQFGEQDDNLSVRCDGEVGGGSAPANDGTYNYSTEDLWAEPVILHDIHSDSVQLIFSQEFISCRVQYTPADYYHEYYSAEHHTPLDIQPEWTYVDYADGDLLPLAGPGTHYWIRVKFLNGNELDEKTEQAMNLTLPPGISVTDWYEMFFMFEIQ